MSACAARSYVCSCVCVCRLTVGVRPWAKSWRVAASAEYINESLFYQPATNIFSKMSTCVPVIKTEGGTYNCTDSCQVLNPRRRILLQSGVGGAATNDCFIIEESAANIVELTSLNVLFWQVANPNIVNLLSNKAENRHKLEAWTRKCLSVHFKCAVN